MLSTRRDECGQSSSGDKERAGLKALLNDRGRKSLREAQFKFNKGRMWSRQGEHRPENVSGARPIRRMFEIYVSAANTVKPTVSSDMIVTANDVRIPIFG
jgi:hypothetical protein